MVKKLMIEVPQHKWVCSPELKRITRKERDYEALMFRSMRSKSKPIARFIWRKCKVAMERCVQDIFNGTDVPLTMTKCLKS